MPVNLHRLILSLLILLLPVGCQASPGPTALPITLTAPAPGPFPSLTPAPPGGTLIVGLDAPVDSLDPAAAYGATLMQRGARTPLV